MAISSANAATAPKTRRVETLTSGTSWTVPTGVEYVNATLVGGGGGGGSISDQVPMDGVGGQVIETYVATTPGASITYAIGAGGAGAANASDTSGSQGGTTTFTGATSATGGQGGSNLGGNGLGGTTGTSTIASNNYGRGGRNTAGGAGGSGTIYIEYWV